MNSIPENTLANLDPNISSISTNQPLLLPPPPSIRFQFNGTGGSFCKEMLLGFFFCFITLGIYTPWFIVRLRRYICNNTIFILPSGQIQLSFAGTGGECFQQVFLGYLLTLFTFFIYFPWFWCNLKRFMINNTLGTAPDGTKYRLEFSGTGGELFGPLFISIFLTMITFGIYAPWAVCKMQRLLAEKTGVYQESVKIGQILFQGQGADFFVIFLVGYLLTGITAGLYMPWFRVQMEQFFLSNTEIEISNQRYKGEFFGAGWDLFKIFLSGILISFTLGIYYFWFFVKLQRFFTNHTGFREILPTPQETSNLLPEHSGASVSY